MKPENTIKHEKSEQETVHNFRSFTSDPRIRKSASSQNRKIEEVRREFHKQLNKINRDNTEQI